MDLNENSNKKFTTHMLMTMGHDPKRYVGGEKEYMYTKEAQQLHDDMRELIKERIKEHGHVTVNCALSPGADMILGYAALSERTVQPDNVSLHCMISYEGQGDKLKEDDKKHFNYLRQHAQSEQVRLPTWKMLCNSQRDREMVKKSDECTAVYNGFIEQGGTHLQINNMKASGKLTHYLGGYMLKDKEISTEVQDLSYIPTNDSQMMYNKVKAMNPEEYMETVYQKDLAKSVYKNLYKSESTNNTIKSEGHKMDQGPVDW